MTKKDYVMLAAVIKAELDLWTQETLIPNHYAKNRAYGVRCLAVSLGAKLGLDNPRFDQDKFMIAAGIR